MRTKAKQNKEYSQEALQGLTYTGIPDRVLACLTELLRASRTYMVKVGIHENLCTFVSFRKALVKDMSKYIDRRADKKMPLCYILTFEGFELFLVVDSMQDFRITADGMTCVYATYEVSINEAN